MEHALSVATWFCLIVPMGEPSAAIQNEFDSFGKALHD